MPLFRLWCMAARTVCTADKQTSSAFSHTVALTCVLSERHVKRFNIALICGKTKQLHFPFSNCYNFYVVRSSKMFFGVFLKRLYLNG